MTRYVVHRGGAALWPENTLLAFRNAIALGVRTLEFDVHGTVDGDVAVIHDPTVDRTTNGVGAVSADLKPARTHHDDPSFMQYSSGTTHQPKGVVHLHGDMVHAVGRLTIGELRGLRVRTREGQLTEEWVPTLAEVLALAGPAGVALLVEVKTPGPAVAYERVAGAVKTTPGARYDGLEARVLARLRDAGVAERTIIMAFNPAVIAEVRALAPRQMTALLVERRHIEGIRASSTEPVEWAARTGANFLGIHYSVCDASTVAAARAAGLALGVYTVNDEADVRRLAALGVDVIITDRADLVATLQSAG